MKKLFFFSLLIILFYSFLLASTPKEAEEKIIVKVDKHSFIAEIANTPKKRQQGLMYRKNLCPSCGMLFVFKKEQPLSFWMKNTFIPLDIVFINRKKKIVDFVTLKPCEEENPCIPYPSKKPAQYVLEVNAGSLTNVLGQKVDF